MRSAWFRAPALLALIAAVAAAQPGKDGKDGKKGTSPPAAGVIAVTDSIADALRMLPRFAILPAEDYQKLLADAARLAKLLDGPRSAPPGKCHVKGKAEGGLLSLQVTFDFDAPAGTLVRLACVQGLATAAAIDGRTPALIANHKAGKDAEPGFAVQSDKAGAQTLTLDLLVPLSARPGGQGVTLDLPRAAITSIEIELPPGAREPRLSTKGSEGKAPEGKAPEGGVALKGQTLSGPIGPAERLDLAWRTPATAASTPVTEAVGVVTVRAEPRGAVVTEAKLELRVLGGQVKAWKLLVPPDAEVTTDTARVEKIVPAGPLRTLHLKEATSDPLEVTVRSITNAPKNGPAKAAPVGPFNVLEAVRQTGTVLVSASSPEMHLELKQHGDLSRRALTDEERKRDPSLVAAFRYGPNAAAGRSWLEVEAETVAGQLTARPAHALRLVEDGEGGPSWVVETTLHVTPRWSDVGRLVVTLPAGCEYEPDAAQPLPARVKALSFDRTTRALEFRLERGGAEAGTPFTVRFAARYSVPADAPLPLPRPAGAIEPDGTLTAGAPASLELVPGENPALELTKQGPHELAYRIGRRHPPSVALRWRPYLPPAEVTGLVSLTLGPGEGRVRHELAYSFPAAEAPKRLRLRLPPAPAGDIVWREAKAEREGGHLVFTPARGGGRLVLEYSFPLKGGLIDVPLAVPEGVTRNETKVRVWSEAGRLPTLAPCKWVEAPIEEAPGASRLPCLVARPLETGEPLRLRLPEGGGEGQLLVSRALVRADVDEAGVQSYRIGYRVERVAGPHVDVELPGHVTAIGFQATLDGKRVDHEMASGRSVRLRLSPSLVPKPSILELSYQLPPAGGAMSVPLSAPRLPGASAFPARWQISTPGAWVVLGPEPGAAPRVWGRVGWLLAPRPAASSADLDRWLSGEEPADAARDEPSLVVWRDGGEDVTLARVPRQGWLLACSLLACAVGLVLGWLGRDAAGWAWGVGLGLLVAAIAGAALWPGLAGQVAYGCQPGVAVLILVGAAMWVLHERRRRRLVFLPSFSRTRPGSTMSRRDAPSSQRGPAPEGQQSTVDAPRVAGSGIDRPGG